MFLTATVDFCRKRVPRARKGFDEGLGSQDYAKKRPRGTVDLLLLLLLLLLYLCMGLTKPIDSSSDRSSRTKWSAVNVAVIPRSTYPMVNEGITGPEGKC